METTVENVLLEDLNPYTSKSGNFGCTVTISQKVGRKIKRLELFLKDEKQADTLDTYLGTELKSISFELDQNKFGLRIGNILDIQV